MTAQARSNQCGARLNASNGGGNNNGKQHQQRESSQRKKEEKDEKVPDWNGNGDVIRYYLVHSSFRNLQQYVFIAIAVTFVAFCGIGDGGEMMFLGIWNDCLLGHVAHVIDSSAVGVLPAVFCRRLCCCAPIA